MPFTPYHFGPGAAIKAVAPNHFSFSVFCFVQIITDAETAFYMLRDEYPLHRFFHTFIGATLVAAFGVLVGRPFCEFALRTWRAWPQAPFKSYFPTTPAISLPAAISGALIGTYSHVILDGIMHPDVTPFMPFSNAKPFYGAIGLFALHASCLILGLFGAFYSARRTRNI